MSAGDILNLKYEADGLILPLNLGGDEGASVTWSVHQLTSN